jgi:ABC-2 type transport system permease protein
MSTLAFEVKASYAFIERNFFIVRRYWAWELVWLVYSIVNSLSVSYIGFGMEKLGGQGIDSHFLVVYLAIGTLVWRYLSSVFYWVTDVVGMERWEGTIEYTACFTRPSSWVRRCSSLTFAWPTPTWRALR